MDQTVLVINAGGRDVQKMDTHYKATLFHGYLSWMYALTIPPLECLKKTKKEVLLVLCFRDVAASFQRRKKFYWFYVSEMWLHPSNEERSFFGFMFQKCGCILLTKGISFIGFMFQKCGCILLTKEEVLLVLCFRNVAASFQRRKKFYWF